MNLCEIGQEYTIYSVPLVFRGRVEKETPLAIYLKAGTVERVLDGDTIGDDESWVTAGEKLVGQVVIEKMQGLIVIARAKPRKK